MKLYHGTRFDNAISILNSEEFLGSKLTTWTDGFTNLDTESIVYTLVIGGMVKENAVEVFNNLQLV